MRETKELLHIIKNFLNNEKYMSENKIDEKKLYSIAKANMVSNFLQNWAVEHCESVEIKNKIQTDYNVQILKDTNENVELENILNHFENENVKTVVLKGAIMKQIYPQNYMRQMCDIDILVEEKSFKTACKILKNLGYSKFYNYEKHLIFSKNFITIELHHSLLLERDEGYEYFKNIWPMCAQYKEYQNVYQLNIEDSYIFCIVHLLLHFKFTGIQIRDILDVYLYHEKYKDTLDYAKLNAVFEKLNIVKFERNIRGIADKWFANDNIDCIDFFDDIEKFILKGASLNNSVHYHVGEKQGKGKYLVQLFFPNLSIMKEKYPILRKMPILLPVTWIARIFKDIFSKESTVKNRLDTIKLIQEAKPQDIEHVQEIYKNLGIIERD